MMMADVNEEDIGIRTFELRKHRAAERSIERIRHHLGDEWDKLSSDEIDLLSWSVGEVWALMGYYQWERLQLSTVKLSDIRSMISIARDIVSHRKMGGQGFDEIKQILAGLGG